MLSGMRHKTVPLLGLVVLVIVTAACSESAAGTADYRGRDYSKQGDYKNAIKEFDKAIRHGDMKRTWASKPFYVAAIYYNRGNAYLNLGQQEQAERDYAKAKDLGYSPHSPDPYGE